MPGAGKSVFVSACARNGLKIVGMGDAVRAAAGRAGVPDESIGRFADAERSKYGPTIWAVRTLSSMSSGDYVVDGLRSEAELAEFRSALGRQLLLVAVHASPAARRSRLEGRGRGDDVEEFARRDARELGWGVGNVVALADVMLVNEGSIAELEERAAEVAGRLIRTR
jgi:dephospho-CoA kinase